ncbi:MAG: phosphomethylpyrimidine synthase ThiC [Candidatus Omnitrophica bacterium]|nr:phosphomethylpyrimidine synthase ThiC [Candidatus Omnitrophota bacterium]MDD5591725.1 phosphomethylpyrimidine synthase ThiC [Candidatus Omnitrophota bacterium]
MTQLEYAKNNTLTTLMKGLAQNEGIPQGLLLKYIKEGRAVIPQNKNHKIKKPCAIGYGLRTKINANIGTSTDKSSLKEELKKLAVAVRYGADTIMDLSVGGNIKKIRREILRRSPVPIGTVPVYEIAVNAQKTQGDFLKFNADDVIATLESQAKEGVDFFTIHAGVTKKSLAALKKHKRILDIVSRGGAIIASWMTRYKKENPFFEYFDKILDIAYSYDVTLSLGDGLRPGSILDATDEAQISELEILGKLAQQAKRKNVQVMIEGPGHVPLNEIKKNIALEKRLCHQAPFYVLGPLVTDIAAGYDHISASIGAALAASLGADFLCYVTASEHLRHPSVEDVREGVIASKIAAHAADIAKGVKSAIERDKQMSLARKKRDWKKQITLSIDPDKARCYRNSSKPKLSDVCTMCGRYCSIKLIEKCNAGVVHR